MRESDNMIIAWRRRRRNGHGSLKKGLRIRIVMATP